MLQCYSCGCKIAEGQGRRRKVVAEERSGRLGFGDQAGPPGDDQLTYSSRRMRWEMVCAACAEEIDAKQKRALIIGLVAFAVVIALFLVLLFTVFLPMWNKAEKQQQRDRERMQREQDDFKKRNNL